MAGELFEGWEMTTRGTREDPAARRYIAGDVAALRKEFAELGVPLTRETLAAYLHGFGQTLNRITVETGYFPHAPHDWGIIRPAAVVELARELDHRRVA